MAQESCLKLMAVGDIGFIGEVSKNIDAYGPEHPFQYVEPILSQGDIIFGNLEKPFSKKHRPFFDYLSKNSIANAKGVDSLVHGHFNIVSLANNHILDFGPEGLANTIDLLDEKGIKHVGAGFNLTEARRPVIIEKKGIRVGFLAYAKKSENTAGKETPGAAPLDYKNVIKEDILNIRGKVDVVVVSLHFGVMYTDFPTIEDRNLARQIIQDGANIILGHHPHVVQGMERHNGGIILYSLGEFVFDSKVGNIHMEWVENKRKESLIFVGEFCKPGISGIEVYHTTLNEKCQSYIPEVSIRDKLSKRFEKISQKIDSLNHKELNEHIGTRTLSHQLKVFQFHIRKLNLLYLFKKLLKIRRRHLFYALGFISQKIKHSHKDDEVA